tara:strand:- start:1836 stop:4427 length:2592 start_codon:yes stop_codon:yes gene_type:complete
MKNGPYNVMRYSDWDRAPRDPATVGTAIFSIFSGGAALAGTTVAFGLTVGGIVGYVAISIVTSWALQALAPKQDFGAVGSQGILVNQKNPISPHKFVYGQARVGGTITYYETTGGNNKFLHQIITLTGHEVEEIGDIYLNDEVVTWDASTGLVDGRWKDKIRIRKHLGDQTTPDADLLAESNQIDGAFVGNGISYLYVRYEFDQDVFANGIPLITAVVKGKKVYDPRTAATAYSANAALCVRDYITSAYGLQDADVDDTVFSVAANVCDEVITLADGGTEARYSMNGVVSGGVSHSSILGQMMTACAGTLFWGAGQWKLIAADYVAPTKVLTLDDLRSGIDLDTRTNLRDQFNAVQGTFNNAGSRWITTDYPPLTSAVFQTEDGGEQTLLDMQLPLTTSGSTAQRIAKLTLFRAREQMTFSADFGLNALDVEVGEIIALTIERYNWDEKEFEVAAWKFGPNGEAGDLRVTLTLRETSEAAFDWNAEESDIISNNTNLPSLTEVPSVGLSAIAKTKIIGEKLVNIVTVTVTSGASERIDYVEVELKLSTDSAFVSLGTGQLGDFDASDLENANYDFRGRAISSFGIKGEWEYVYNINASEGLEPPSDVEGFVAEVNGSVVTLDWTPAPDLDLSFYRIRFSPVFTGATWANSITFIDKVPRPASSVSVPARAGTYIVRAYDKSGIASVGYTSVVIQAADVEQFLNTASLTDSPSFTGTKTNTEVVSNALRLTTYTTGPSTGEYFFSNYIENQSSQVTRCRVYVKSVNNRIDSSAGLFDDQPGLFDNAPGNFDDLGGDSQFADTTVITYVSVTQDDPAGTPTWSGYSPIKVADISGRAFKFKVELISTTSNVTPSITSMTAYVENN